jgi:hypothetical protein
VLISDDTGPWKFLSRFRSWLKREERKNPVLKKSDAAHGVECLRCSSVHIALAVSAYAALRHRIESYVTIPADIFLSAMALSAIAILLNRIPKR